jgi:hypothetical protein
MKKVKLTALVVAFLSVLFITQSCKKDEDEDSSNSNSNPSSTCTAASFESTSASGQFRGEIFTVVDGMVEEDPFDSEKYRVELYSEQNTSKCESSSSMPVKMLIFSVPKKTGTTNLSFSIRNPQNNYTVTFNYAPEPNNVEADIAACGKIEILTITSDKITGRIVADDQTGDNKINGTFEASFCP